MYIFGPQNRFNIDWLNQISLITEVVMTETEACEIFLLDSNSDQKIFGLSPKVTSRLVKVFLREF